MTDEDKMILQDISITPLLKAKAKLEFAIQTAKSDLERTGAIKCFEFCYELSWKLMRKILLKKGIETGSPRDAFREAANNHLIDDPEVWFEFILKRNATSHTYDEDLAEEMFHNFLPKFEAELNKFMDRISILST